MEKNNTHIRAVKLQPFRGWGLDICWQQYYPPHPHTPSHIHTYSHTNHLKWYSMVLSNHNSNYLHFLFVSVCVYMYIECIWNCFHVCQKFIRLLFSWSFVNMLMSDILFSFHVSNSFILIFVCTVLSIVLMYCFHRPLRWRSHPSFFRSIEVDTFTYSAVVHYFITYMSLCTGH